MDGHYHTKIVNWFHEQKTIMLNGQSHTSNHIDEVLGPIQEDKWVEVTLEFIQIIAELIVSEGLSSQIDALAVIPLISEEFELSMDTPKSILDVKKGLDISPPSIGLRRIPQLGYIPFENYVCPLDFALIADERFYCTYSQERSEADRKNHFEYGRSIDIEFFPEGRRTSNHRSA